MRRDPKTGRLPPKKRNDRALMLARQRRHTKAESHQPKKLFSINTSCIRCGIRLSYNKDLRKHIVG